MDAFVITLIISIAIEIFKERDKLFKIKPIDYSGWFIIIALSISTFYAWDNNKQNDIKIQSLIDGKRSITQQLISERVENILAQKQHEQSIKDHDYHTVEILAKYGLKVDSINERIEKIKTASTSPLITIMPGSKSFSFVFTSDTLFVKGYIQNTGKGIAFAANVNTQLFLLYKDSVFRFRWRLESNWIDHDIGENVSSVVQNYYSFRHNKYDLIDKIILVVTGFYYSDYERKIKRDIYLGVIYDTKSSKYGLLDASSMKTKEMIKTAPIAYFLYD